MCCERPWSDTAERKPDFRWPGEQLACTRPGSSACRFNMYDSFSVVQCECECVLMQPMLHSIEERGPTRGVYDSCLVVQFQGIPCTIKGYKRVSFWKSLGNPFLVKCYPLRQPWKEANKLNKKLSLWLLLLCYCSQLAPHTIPLVSINKAFKRPFCMRRLPLRKP